jgi:hypothetical protein
MAVFDWGCNRWIPPFGFKPVRPVPNNSIEVFTKASSAMLLMWTATAVGLVALFKAATALFPVGMILCVQIAAGFLMALFCGPLLRANRTVEDMLKKS